MIQSNSLADKAAEAVSFIREHCPSDGYVLGFSGGKDSIVTYWLTRMSGVPFKAYISLVPGNDNPDVLRFVRRSYPDVSFTIARRGTGFIQQIEKRGLPSFRMRWCCKMFKEDAEYSKGRSLLTGIRAEESRARAALPRISFLQKTTMIKPIFHWSEDDVWSFIDRLSLPYPSLYDTGFSRVGCVICPFSLSGSKPSVKRMLQSMEQHRTLWLAVKRAAHKYFTRKIRSYDSFESYWRCFLVGFHPEKVHRLEGIDVPV